MLIVLPGEGEALPGPGPLSIVARQEWSEGNVLVFDQELPPGALTPAHRHTDETQGAYVIAGSIGFWVDGEETIAGPGTYVVRPKGSVHALWNAGDEPARMLEITSPAARYQEFVGGLHAVAPAEIAEYGARFGTYLHDDVTAELRERLG